MNSPSPLTPAQTSSFNTNGYLIIPNILPPSEIQTLRASLHKTIEHRTGCIPSLCSTTPTEYKVMSNEELQDRRRNSRKLGKLSSTNGSGGVLDIHHSPALDTLRKDKRMVNAVVQVWKESYGMKIGGFDHPFFNKYDEDEDGNVDADNEWMVNFDEAVANIDRIGYRVPDVFGLLPSEDAPPLQTIAEANKPLTLTPKQSRTALLATQAALKKSTIRANQQLQRSITPHLDCCPERLFTGVTPPFNSSVITPKLSRPLSIAERTDDSGDGDGDGENYPPPPNSFWRPIQCFLALTETLIPNSGGFECSNNGDHLTFPIWSSSPASDPSSMKKQQCVGDYSPLRSPELVKSITHLPIPAGSLVLWDVKLPHATSLFNSTLTARENVYLSYGPSTKCNERYGEWVEELKRVNAVYKPTGNKGGGNGNWMGSESVERIRGNVRSGDVVFEGVGEW